jgi:hypothetical protein
MRSRAGAEIYQALAYSLSGFPTHAAIALSSGGVISTPKLSVTTWTAETGVCERADCLDGRPAYRVVPPLLGSAVLTVCNSLSCRRLAADQWPGIRMVHLNVTLTRVPRDSNHMNTVLLKVRPPSPRPPSPLCRPPPQPLPATEPRPAPASPLLPSPPSPSPPPPSGATDAAACRSQPPPSPPAPTPPATLTAADKHLRSRQRR